MSTKTEKKEEYIIEAVWTAPTYEEWLAALDSFNRGHRAGFRLGFLLGMAIMTAAAILDVIF